MRRLLALIAAALSAGSTLAVAATPSTTPVEAAEATASGHAVVAEGHVDLGPRFVDGTWRIQVRDDTVDPPVWRNLPDVVLHAVNAARMRIPARPEFSFLGGAGASVWLLPQVQVQGVLWPGWNTQDPEVAARVVREVEWRLHGVRGPGRFVLYSNGTFGEPRILFTSARGYPQQIGIDVDTHVHGNWAFSAPGTYILDIELTARTREGATVADREALRVFVGPGAPEDAFAIAAPTPSSGSRLPSRLAWLAAAAGAFLVAAAAAAVVWRRRREAGRAPPSPETTL